MISALLAGTAFNLSQVCAQPAPDFPTLTAEDWFNALSPVHTGDFALSVQRFEQWVLAYMWPSWCICSDGGPPGASAPTTIPPPSQNPGLPDGSGAAPCWDQTSTIVAAANAPSGTPVQLLTSTLLPVTTTVPVTSQITGGPTTAQSLPVGTANVHYAFSAPLVGLPISADLSIEWFNATGGSLGQHPNVGLDGQSAQLTPVTVPSGAASWAAWTSNPNTRPLTITFQWQFTCGSSGPNVLDVPCCPPDPALEMKLNQVLQLLLTLNTGGSTAPPISWHDGVRHSALRGAGSFLIDTHAIGIRFEVTTPPQGVKVDPGNPDFYWDMGFWTPYALSSPLRGGRLVFLRQSVELPEFTDQIGYTLKHGTVMDAIELLPTTS